MKYSVEQKNEKGIALVFAISIVALMMMLAITYTSVAITGRDVALNTTNGTSARLLAENCVKNVLFVLNQYASQNSSGITVNALTRRVPTLMQLRSGGEAAPNENNSTGLEKLLAIPNNLIYTNANNDMFNLTAKIFAVDNTNRPAPRWQFVKDENNKLIARFAYVTYKPHGLLDPFASAGLASAPANPLGRFVAEDICPKAIEGFSTISFPVLTDNICTHHDWNTIFKEMNRDIVLSSASNDDVNNKIINRYFTYPRAPFADETFWYKKSTDTSPHQYYRFNLNRTATDWSTFVVEGSGENDITCLNNLKEYNETNNGILAVSNDSKCIPWFAASAETALSDAQRRQVAANFIAFMAELNGQTVHSDLLNTSKDYFANIRAPYLNEISVKYDFSLLQTDEKTEDSTTSYKYTLKITADVKVELLNYYALNNTYKIDGDIMKISGFQTSSSSFLLKPTIFKGVTVPECTIKGSDLDKITISGPGFYTINKKIEVYNQTTDWVTTTPSNAYTYAKLNTSTTLKPGNLAVMVDSTSKTVDYAKLSGHDEALNIWDMLGSGLKISVGSNISILRSWYAQDARNNLAKENWVIAESETIGAANSAPSGTKDSVGTKDIMGYDPGNVMPYISNEAKLPDTSNFHPGMLGLIHRGTNGQTLNISKYDKDNKSKFIAEATASTPTYQKDGIGKYEYGDAYLLDQLSWNKINGTNRDVYEYGKINLNMIHKATTNDPRDNQEAAKLLFNNIGFTDAASKIETIAEKNKSEIEYDSPANTKRTYDFRYQVLEDLALSSDLKQDNDAIIGKFIFHTTAGEAPFEADNTVIVVGVAQMIKENTVKVKDGTIHNGTTGTWDSDADDILSTQRVIAVLQKTNQGKWVIVRMEYVDAE